MCSRRAPLGILRYYDRIVASSGETEHKQSAANWPMPLAGPEPSRQRANWPKSFSVR